MHLFYTSCIIYEHRAALYAEWVKSLKVVKGLVFIQLGVFNIMGEILKGK